MQEKNDLFYPLKEYHGIEQTLENLHLFGVDVLNIEGADIVNYLKSDAIWLNLAMVLDRPLIEGITLDELSTKNTFTFKEMSLLEYDEIRAHLATLLIIKYYLAQGHELLNKQPNDELKFLIHIHRRGSASKFMQLLTELIQKFSAEEFKLSTDEKKFNLLHNPNKNITIYFREGFEADKSDPIYAYMDIVFSYSLVAGLNPKLHAGDLTLPYQFIPYDINENKLFKSRQYHARNRLRDDLAKIVSQPQACYFDALEKSFGSENPLKQLKAKEIKEDDFKMVPLLQVNGLFYPKEKNKPFDIENSAPNPMSESIFKLQPGS